MNQTTRTISFLAVAVACVGIATATHYRYKPVDLAAFSDVGSEFYPDFKDPNVATGLRVASYNSDTGRTDTFRVESRNGLWRIPSHHDYPADGQDRLARTAASIVGVERQALVERSRSAHRRYNLLDPLDSEVSASEGRGDRVTLYQGNDVLVDIIVGSRVEGEEEVYYVRRADEDRFYTANLGRLELSTRFADWIHRNVLDVRRNDIRELVVDRYRISSQGEQIPGDQYRLSRESATASWKMAELDETKEKLKSSEINNTLAALDDLRIVGVRKKPEGLSAGLKAEEGASITRTDLLDLQEKGFYLSQGGHIFSNEGETIVGTGEGIQYVLRFGSEFSGSDVDIEVGSRTSAESPAEETAQEQPAEEDAAAAEEPHEAHEENGDSGLKKSRYLFVTVQFNEDLIGEKPVPPTRPDPAAETAPPGQDVQDDSDEKKPADEENPAEGDEQPEGAKPEPQEDDEKALEQYELEQEVYETKLKEHEERIEKGRERVAELNRRFADWYYVISADVFDRLKLNRDDLVDPVDPPADEEPKQDPVTDAPATPADPEEKSPEVPEEASPQTPDEKSDSAAAAPAASEPNETPPASDDSAGKDSAEDSKPEAAEQEPEPARESSDDASPK